ncbi:MAG TPA: GxxExxY protein [Saprospiraceae bacterium]|nr:GxxExxY protein [Saprospirales bacterium]HRQ30774.1 GxxExxY protein [Saprospiraceae bacterium]
MNKKQLNDLIYKVNGAAIEVHKALGPGLLESVYHKCMVHELMLRKIKFVSEMNVPVGYKGLEVLTELKCDLFVENTLVVELKSVDQVLPIHEAQLQTYLKLLEAPMGLMINFNVVNIFREGQKTYVNELFRNL